MAGVYMKMQRLVKPSTHVPDEQLTYVLKEVDSLSAWFEKAQDSGCQENILNVSPSVVIFI